MTKEQFIHIDDGMTDAQKVAAFNYLIGYIAHCATESSLVEPKKIQAAFQKSCEFAKAEGAAS